MQTEQELHAFISGLADDVKRQRCTLRFALVRAWSAACTHMADRYRKHESERPRCKCSCTPSLTNR
jgi:hypothetical protein